MADVEAAIARASTLLPDPSSTGLAQDWKDETIELWLMPAVPPNWPAANCRLVFYVFAWFVVEPKPRDGLYWEDPLPYAWGGIEAIFDAVVGDDQELRTEVWGRGDDLVGGFVPDERLGSELWASRYSRIAHSSSSVLRWTPCLIARLVKQ
ncbi:MAG: hypothetical protein R6X02_22820 [Enhygromyxa sp.]